MAIFNHDGAELYYEIHGEGFPVLLIAPGGMRSAVPFWDNTPWNPIEDLQAGFQVVAMDQRNAGQSTGPVSAGDGWHTFTADQLALMDHLGAENFHVAGMCIGGPYSFGLIEAAPERVKSVVLFQTIGRDDNRQAFYEMFDSWAVDLRARFPDMSDADWRSFRGNMYDGDKVFFNVDEDFVAGCQTPLIVLCGKDHYHPESSSRLVADLAPNVQFIEDWKEGAARDAARIEVRQFLVENTPAD
jgi:pimeloyl-ACP methyl ester carboxylesterase